jgi:exopolysaccharide production protein ExoQ
MGQLILLLCYGFIGWLFAKDFAWRKAGGLALLVPGAWIAIQGSRPVSYWIGHGGGSESNPVNTLVFGLLIGSSLLILLKRNLSWSEIIFSNKMIFLTYSYFFLSVLWSEMPGDSLKRIIKDFGCVLAGLVFLSAFNPAHALKAIYVRVSYILFPLSVVFIKYFPHIGRQSNRAGDNMFTGVTTQKNILGETVFVFSLFLLWDLIEIYRSPDKPGKKLQLALRGFMLAIGLWLLYTCDSKTSVLCLILGTIIFWLTGRLLRMTNGKAVLIGLLVGAGCLVWADKSLGISDAVIRALGRDPSMTGRTGIWEVVLDQKTDPMLGTGFCVFWDTDKGQNAIDQLMRINSAHNGYLEMYLDGGMIGVSLLVLLLLAAGARIINALFAGHPLGRMGLVFWILAIVYNFSESSFFRLDVLWFTLLMLTIGCGQWKEPEETRPSDEETDFQDEARTVAG